MIPKHVKKQLFDHFQLSVISLGSQRITYNEYEDETHYENEHVFGDPSKIHIRQLNYPFDHVISIEGHTEVDVINTAAELFRAANYDEKQFAQTIQKTYEGRGKIE